MSDAVAAELACSPSSPCQLTGMAQRPPGAQPGDAGAIAPHTAAAIAPHTAAVSPMQPCGAHPQPRGSTAAPAAAATPASASALTPTRRPSATSPQRNHHPLGLHTFPPLQLSSPSGTGGRGRGSASAGGSRGPVTAAVGGDGPLACDNGNYQELVNPDRGSAGTPRSSSFAGGGGGGGSSAATVAVSPSAAARARLDARRAALNAKLAGQPMSSLAHYNCAMELTRQIGKHVAYPSPYTRGRSAYKIPSGEPEDAPDGWRDQVGLALRLEAGQDGGHPASSGGGGPEWAAVRLDAAYLRRGCILLVVEYSRRRRPGNCGGAGSGGWAAAAATDGVGAHAGNHSPLSLLGLPNGASGSSGGCGRAEDSRDGGSRSRRGLEAEGGGPPLPLPVLSYQALLHAFGQRLLRPGGKALDIEAQHFVGPTGGDTLVASGFTGGGGSPAAGQTRQATSDAGEDGSAAAVPRLALLGPPCVLASYKPLFLHVLAFGAAAGASSHAATRLSGSGVPAFHTQQAAPPPPRLLARYSSQDAAPQSCCVLLQPSEGGGKGEREDQRAGEQLPASGGLARAPAVAVSGTEVGDLGADVFWGFAPRAPGRSLTNPALANAAAAAATAGGDGVESVAGGARQLCVVAGTCPRPGLLLLEMESEPLDLCVSPSRAARTAGHAAADGAALLSAPLPVVVVDDPAVQQEINAVAAAATSVVTAAAVDAGQGSVAAAATAAATAAHEQPPAWLLSFLYDIGQFLELSALEGARRQLEAAARRGPQGAEVSHASHALALGTARRCMNNYCAEVDAGMAADSGSDSGSWSIYESGSEEGDGAASAAAAALPPHVEDDVQHLLCLAAGLASYACRQGLPALLSCVLSRAAASGVSLLRLDEEVGWMAGGLGLAHLAVLSGSAEVVEALLMHARYWAADDPDDPAAATGGAAPPPSAASTAAAAGAPLRLYRQQESQQGAHSSSNHHSNGASGGGAGGVWMWGQLASMNACTALFVRPGPGGATALHLVALAHGRAPGLAEPLLSLCPLAAHAWFQARDGGGSSAAQYALQAGAVELNEQCEELLVLEALEADALGCADPELLLAGVLTEALQLASQPPGATAPPLALAEPEQEPGRGYAGSGGGHEVAAAAGTTSLAGDLAPALCGDGGGGGPDGGAERIDGAFAAAAAEEETTATAAALEADRKHRKPSSTHGRGSSTRRSAPVVLRSVAAALRCLPWAAPLRGFVDPALERSFAARTAVLALQRNRITMAFYVFVVSCCLQKALLSLAASGVAAAATGQPARPTHELLSASTHGSSPLPPPGARKALVELLFATGASLAKVLASGLVAALRLRGAAHDGVLATADVLCGVVVAGSHLAGRPHPEAFEVADLGMQEALTSLFHCLIQPVMEQTSTPLVSLISAVACTLMEWPMALSHGWRGAMAAWLLLGRFTAGLSVRYGLAVWARASYLKGTAAAGAGGGGAAGSRVGAAGRVVRCKGAPATEDEGSEAAGEDKAE